MTISTDDLALLRTYVTWDPPTDATIDARYTILWSWEAVALEMVRTRRSQMLDSPSSFSIGGEYSESWTANIEALTKMMNELEAMVPSGTAGGLGFSVGRLVRDGRQCGGPR